jgi:hypothetical protein
MENDNFVETRLAALAPPAEWQPDTAAALRRHHARRREEWRRGPGFWWKLAAAAAILLALALAPPTRALAQRLWRYVTVGRVEVMQLDLDAIPNDSSLRGKIIQHPGKVIKVDGPESARAHLGFLPRLPRAGVLSSPPRLGVMGPVVYGITLKAADLRQLLHHAGLDGESVPPEWDGARILLQTSGTVMAEWPEPDTMLMQSPPLTMATPDNFDLRAFTTLVLRGLKVPRSEAERLGARMASAPAWMLPLDPEDKVGIREVALRTGPATMVYDYDTDHPDRIERLTLIWSVADRIYVLSTGMGDTQAIAAANSIE